MREDGWGIASVLRGIGSVLFATPCAVCDAEDGPICEGCRQELIDAAGQACPRCALSAGPFADLRKGCSACRGRSLGFDAAVALGPYQGPIRELCIRLKAPRNAWLAGQLVDVLLQSRGGLLREHCADLLVPVPLHWQRRLARGYNQAEALASALATRLKVPNAAALSRVRRTPKLHDRRKGERAEILRDAFAPTKGAELKGKTVLLVDDILTTGATCGAAARALKAAGVSRVVAVVLGRAEVRP